MMSTIVRKHCFKFMVDEFSVAITLGNLDIERELGLIKGQNTF